MPARDAAAVAAWPAAAASGAATPATNAAAYATADASTTRTLDNAISSDLAAVGPRCPTKPRSLHLRPRRGSSAAPTSITTAYPELPTVTARASDRASARLFVWIRQ